MEDDLFTGSATKYKEDYPHLLIHFGAEPGLKELDPDYMGTSKTPSEENINNIPKIHRIYFYREGATPEEVVIANAKSKYLVKKPEEDRLYDLGTDTQKVLDISKNMDVILGKIKGLGYFGFFNSKSALPNVVALFYKTPVLKEETAPEDLGSELGKKWLSTNVQESE